MPLFPFSKVIRRGLASALLGAILLLPAQAGTKVRIATPVGNIDLELYDQERPITVQNFLKYVSSGRYAGSFSHRLIPGFVLQGGGFRHDSNGYAYTDLYPPIQNEYANLPLRSNVKGTITMAKVGGNPDSATSQWFINLQDNNTGTADDGNLDLQNGGFTVFGRVVAGMNVLEIFNTGFVHSDTQGRGVYDASTYFADQNNEPNLNFTDMPLMSGMNVEAGLLFTTISVLPPEVAPTIKIKAGAKVKTKQAATKIAGSSSGSVVRLEWRIGSKGKFRRQSASTSWKLRVSGLKRGTNVLWVRGVTAEGKTSAFKKIKIVRS